MTPEEREEEIANLVKGLDGDAVIEIGVGLIGRGAFRVHAAHGDAEAAAVMSAVSSTMSSIHLDFLRAAARSGK